MLRSIRTLLTCLTLMLGMLIAVRGAEAQPQISSELLLPYFEVELDPSGLTTLFAVGNALDQPVDIVATLHSNWGIPVDKATLRLAPREVKSFNLRDWLAGNAPGRKLDAKQVAHLKAALSGQRSPQDSMFYSTPIRTNLAVGYVRVKLQKAGPAALWGDWFVVDPAKKSTQGEALVALGQGASCPGLCARHILRYLQSGAFDGGTELIVWTEKAGSPSRQASADPIRLAADSDLYNEAGVLVDGFQVRTLPVQQITLSELKIKEPFGWLDLRTEMDSFVAVRYRSQSQGSALLRTWCLPMGSSSGPGIEIKKLTNGEDANVPPGPSIPVGNPVLWEYVVRNTGDVPLTGIEVKDDQGVAVKCPRTSLNKGESMTCTGRGTAVACQYSNLGTATGRTGDGVVVSDDDSSHYFGEAPASIDLEKLTNGEDADTAPGLKVESGAAVTWTYVVKNTGEVALVNIRVDDDREGAVTCPKRSLRPGESMTCTLKGKAVAGQYRNVGIARGETSCGQTVRDEDASHYVAPPTNEAPLIDIEKLTNGEDADTPTGPNIEVGQPVLWEYIVTNTGKVALSNIRVVDDKGVAVSCPKTALGVGESMTCTGRGTAVAGQYANLGTVTAKDPKGDVVADEDPSHYFGVKPLPVSIDIEKHTNGEDADSPKGPEIEVGDPVLWQYYVKNTGQATLSTVKVTDDKGVSVSCPKTTLAAGETMTCTGNGTATEAQYKNIGTVTAKGPKGETVTDSDPSHYFGVKPLPVSIDIEKHTNGEDADSPKGPEIEVGEPVLWQYYVKNTGQGTLSTVQVTDDKGVSVSCPKTTLAAGETMTCTGNGTATEGQYKNIGTVTAKGPKGETVTDSDPSHYLGVRPLPVSIDIEKHTNGEDADSPKGPEIEVGEPVLWQYYVKNTGQATLSTVQVTDDKGVSVSCPKTTLAAGETMTCTGNGTATEGQYKNIGTVTAKGPKGETATDSDPSHYYGVKPLQCSIDIEKHTNGEDADWPKGPEIEVGKPVLWQYYVKNTGQATLSTVKVTDDKGVSVSCPKTTLAAGETMTCTGNGTATEGQYKNIGTVTAKDPKGQTVTDSDPSHYYGVKPLQCSIDIEKHTNGEDADWPKGPEIEVGKPVLWQYYVKNTGQATLSTVKVADDKGVSVSCPKTTLAAGETMTCTGNGTATEGQYKNIGTVTAKDPKGQTVTDSDPSHYYGVKPLQCSIDIEKHTNGEDADWPKGPEIEVGKPVLWQYYVKNTGQTTLSNVKVTDDKGVSVSCPKTTLAAGETMTCTGNSTATEGQYKNIGTVTAKDSQNRPATDSDPSHYYGVKPPQGGNQGCTPGYWKNHSSSWPATGYSVYQKVQSVFGQAYRYPSFGYDTLIEALSYHGGSGTEGAIGNLLRAATASLLNSEHPGVSFPWTATEVISEVNAALAGGNRDEMLGLATALDRDNNLGCPLN